MRKTGQEQFTYGPAPISQSLLHFWQWAYSDLLNNAQRGVLAEFIVAQAVGVDSTHRVEWASYDLITEGGLKIEVKSSAYLQSWKQSRPSLIQFDIKPTREFLPDSNYYELTVQRQAHVYVFCLFEPTNRQTADVLNLEQWEFYILQTHVLNEKCPAQKKIGLSKLLTFTPHRCRYSDLGRVLKETEEQLVGPKTNPEGP